MNALLAIWHYVQIISPWIITIGIPSIITGLSTYPKPEAKTWAKYLKVMLNMISVLAHADSPTQTFKLPMTMSVPPPGKPNVIAPTLGGSSND